jgi:hypothetical protein
MDCTICGKTSLPGAMLCAPCKAALKRARYITVQEDMRPPSVIDVRRQRRRARSPAVPADAAPQAPLPAMREIPPALGRRIFIGIFVAAAILGGVSYFTQHELGARSHEQPSATPASPTEARQEVAVSVAAPGNADTAVASTAAEASRVVTLGADQAPPTLPAAKLPGTAATKRTALANRATFATANGDPPDAVAAPPPPEIVAAAPAPPPSPVPDRWRNMRDAMAQCDREGVIGSLICGQRVRIQYCDGYWGKVAQCQGAGAAYER